MILPDRTSFDSEGYLNKNLEKLDFLVAPRGTVHHLYKALSSWQGNHSGSKGPQLKV